MPIRILLVEDNPGDAELVGQSLRDVSEAVDVCHVTRLADTTGCLSRNTVDVVLLDLSLPDSHGLDTVIRVRDAADVPIVVLSGHDDEATAMKAMRLGAQDYLIKGTADGPTLVRTVKHAMERHRMRLELDAARQRLQGAERRQRELLERQLVASEARHQAILENVAALVVVTDSTHRIKLFNRRAEEVTGYRRAEMVELGCSFERLFHSDDLDLAGAALDAALAGGAPQPFESRLTDRSGEVRWVRWHATKLADSEACAIGVDVTEERDLERRTRDAERLALIGTLAAGLAHEIRNPLFAAQLQLLLVERRIGRSGAKGLESAQEAAQLVQSELKRLASLVENFLLFSRPSDLRLGTSDLRRTVTSTVALLQPDADQSGVQLDVDLAGAAVEARCDEGRIKQVLLDLLRNAIDAAGTGGDVAVGVCRRNGVAEIVVEDSGPGVPDAIDIFAPFATTKESGTGLGLSIVRRIVTDHDGRVDVSRRAQRTVFTVRLPVCGPAVPANDAEPAVDTEAELTGR